MASSSSSIGKSKNLPVRSSSSVSAKPKRKFFKEERLLGVGDHVGGGEKQHREGKELGRFHMGKTGIKERDEG